MPAAYIHGLIDACRGHSGLRLETWVFVPVSPVPDKERLWRCFLHGEGCQPDGASPPMAISGRRVAARRDPPPHRAEQLVGAGRGGIMTEVTVQVSARRRPAIGRLMQRGRRSGAAVADQTEYASEKLAYGQAVLDLQRAGQDDGRGRAWESLS